MSLKVLYRGSLVSCNYGCDYCPFAKRRETRAELERDREEVERFVAWVEGSRDERFELLFTPWGEALVRPWYRAALVQLSHLEHVDLVAIQTNLSMRLGWVEEASGALALWATYHPGEVTRALRLQVSRAGPARGSLQRRDRGAARASRRTGGSEA